MGAPTTEQTLLPREAPSTASDLTPPMGVSRSSSVGDRRQAGASQMQFCTYAWSEAAHCCPSTMIPTPMSRTVRSSCQMRGRNPFERRVLSTHQTPL